MMASDVKIIFSKIFIWLYEVQIDELMINKDGLNHFIGVRKKYWDAWCMIRKLVNYENKCSMFNAQQCVGFRSIWLRKSLLIFVWHNHITWHITCRKTDGQLWCAEEFCFVKRGVSCDHALELVIGERERLRCAEPSDHRTVCCHVLVLWGPVWSEECGELDSAVVITNTTISIYVCQLGDFP